MIIITTDTTSSGTTILLTVDPYLYVGEGADVTTSSGGITTAAVLYSGSGSNIQVRGSVVGANAGIWLGDDETADSNNVVAIASSGYVFGFTGIKLDSHDSQVINDGEVIGVASAIYLHGQGSGESSVTNTGTVHGGFGIDARFATETIVLTNSGLVGGDVAFLGGLGDTSILNDGDIIGGDTAIRINDDARGRSTITNTGIVQGGNFGIYAGSATGAIILNNHGLVAGGTGAITSGQGDDRIRNDGTIDGYVSLLGGDDRLDTQGGTVNGDVYGGVGNDAFDLRDGVVTGALSGDDGNDTFDLRDARLGGDLFGGDGNDAFDLRGSSLSGAVNGDAGNDTFRPGAGDEFFDGGTGADTIDFKGSSGLRVSLVDGSGTGAAEGDTYRAIENVSGSRGGDDEIVGSGAANTLMGFGGADSIEGGAGNDRIVGGAGHDTLAGQAGNDTFVLSPATADFDAINDFANAVGDDDVFEVSASIFGGALPTGPLAASRFQVRPDNLAQDADDRFIFRTTDQTLWFDVNGLGAGGLTQVADLQAGATMTAADILVVA